MTPSRLLIVNADDFGLSPGVNAGIVEAHRNGIVTSASLMVRQAAAVEAAALARELPTFSLGLHLDLCEWVYRDEVWHPLYEVVPMHDPEAVEREVLTQLDRFEALTGRPPTHLDSHQHVHRHEPVRSVVRREARARGLAVRDETPGLRYCGAFYGQSNRGDPYPDGISVQSLVLMIRSLPEGISEMGCHPAKVLDFQSVYLEERCTELESLCDVRVREALESGQVRLCGVLDPEVQRLVSETR